MAKTKKYDYPQSRNLSARIECIALANAQARQALRACRDSLLPHLKNDDLKTLIGDMVREAIAASELAGQAISGLED